MNKKALSESDICDKFIRPAMEQAGWDGMVQVYREFPLRAGRVVVRGRRAKRDTSTVLRADYALFFKPNIPLAVVEAKDNNHAMGAGMASSCDRLAEYVAHRPQRGAKAAPNGLHRVTNRPLAPSPMASGSSGPKARFQGVQAFRQACNKRGWRVFVTRARVSQSEARAL